MAYRRKLGITKAATFKEDIYTSVASPSEEDDDNNHKEQQGKKRLSYCYSNPNQNQKASAGNDNGSLAARATRASAAHRDSSGYGSAYASPTANAAADSPSSSSSSSSSLSHHRHSDHFRSLTFPKGSMHCETTSDDPKYGFWGILARKAKSILDEDNQFDSSSKMNDTTTTINPQLYQSPQSSQGDARIDNARLRKRLDAITSSLNNFGDTLGNAFEEGRTIMEHKTADIIQETRNRTADFIQETRKIQLRRRGGSSDTVDQPTVLQNTSWQRPVPQPVETNALAKQEIQLKASRDVAMATAAKAKVLQRELKTVKADLAFAKERCAQLEVENKRLRESREKGDNPADDDLIRLQLETLLAEKARLAHENSIYARENRFLKEIVEYHQLTMQDVVYLDEGTEEFTEVYPFSNDDAKVLCSIPTSPMSPNFLPEVSSLSFPEMKEHTREITKEVLDITSSFSSPSSYLVDFPAGCPEGRTDSSEVPTSSHIVADGETEAS
ncbi:uncharacterized protein LOC104898112 [Beta vulgaris subsp. vulgaris]|uniref:uncharacterized protein LOC104898112 n=1 Tax=Beta vulgaris subsp. vulgaris TaxID=3555 RepID=UPI0020373924|nr:uncharacterized protein LOC104898112 [Beta vulgaris subsp. vulgaris]